MKKYLLIVLLACCCINVFGQSITLNDLINISNLPNSEAHNYLVLNKGFKNEYLQEVNGNTMEHLHKVAANKKQETVIIGEYTKLGNGSLLRTVVYNSQTTQHLFNLITQAKSAGLKMNIQGADAMNNIYLFDNNFYHISIFINRNNAFGSIVLKQKEFLGFD
ncbi:hypothetical protein [Mucilaginibacter pocheonensis]|uniref:DUF4252 domain-containing protein n=1 Tax=Mucilaginibacter pocheonensis TaxID=398050 RepID=A0ABU1THL7_9SPHI|nr:hypothetical protein [Mucilaginibacter pocheonensis]MDR6944919.1 hypothetical protein [Mucilaginibacter pocheonensis]